VARTYKPLPEQHLPYTFTTRSQGDGSEPCYVVYFQRDIVATFPVLSPNDKFCVNMVPAREYAERFVDTMNGYYMRRVNEMRP
jgi:hypothetical protein